MPYSKLLEGFKKFQDTFFSEDTNIYEGLISEGQKPHTLVIACSDSRIDPAILMQAEPGDIFVVRNVAAIVPPYEPDGHYHGTGAAVEYAVRILEVKNIIVLGHSHCGGINALDTCCRSDSDVRDYDFIMPWIEIGKKAKEIVHAEFGHLPPEKRQMILEEAVVLQSLGNLLSYPWIRERSDAGILSLHGWYFRMETGKLLVYDEEDGIFAEHV